MTTKRERQKVNRAARREAERKAAQRRARIRTARNIGILVLVVLGPLLLFSLLSGNDDEADATTTTTTTPATTTTTTPEQARRATDYALFAGQPTACGAETPPAPANLTFEAAEDQAIPADATVTAVLTTSCGDITLSLDPSAAPETVNSFVFLARAGYFDGTPMHRIIPSFVIQAGDPTGTGTGSPGYSPSDEFPDPQTTYDVGDVAMANSGTPGSAGSQFFIVVGENQLHLSGSQFTIFGEVVDSQDAIAAITAVPLGFNEFDAEPSRPLESVYIESVAITVE